MLEPLSNNTINMASNTPTIEAKRESTKLLKPLENGPMALLSIISFTTSIAYQLKLNLSSVIRMFLAVVCMLETTLSLKTLHFEGFPKDFTYFFAFI